MAQLGKVSETCNNCPVYTEESSSDEEILWPIGGARAHHLSESCRAVDLVCSTEDINPPL